MKKIVNIVIKIYPIICLGIGFLIGFCVEGIIPKFIIIFCVIIALLIGICFGLSIDKELLK